MRVMMNIAAATLIVSLPCLAQPDTLWTKLYDPLVWNEVSDIVQTAEGGFAFCGYSSQQHGAAKLWIVKTDQSGSQEWEIQWGDSSFYSSSETLLNTPEGNLLVAVSCTSPTVNPTVFLEIDMNGTTLRTTEFAQFEENWINEMNPTSDGGYICGGMAGVWPGDLNALILKLDPEGNPVWFRTIDESQDTQFDSVYETPDGGFIAAGRIEYNSMDYRLITARYDPEGNLLWQLELGDTGNNLAKTIRPAADGGFMLVAARVSRGWYRQWLIKLSPEGVLEWDSLWAGTDDAANVMELASDGNFLLTGATASGSTAELWLAKINMDGDVLWETTMGHTYPIGGMCIAETSDYGYIIGAKFQPGSGMLNALLVRFAAPEGISPDPVPNGNHIASVSPNPSSAEISIEYCLTSSGRTSISAYDLSGRLTAGLVDERLDRGTHTVTWNPEETVPTGCYLIVMETDEGRSVIRCIRTD